MRTKQLSDLAALRDKLNREAREKAERERARKHQAERAAHVADEFRAAVKDVTPLAPAGRHHARPAPHPPVPRQRLRDEQAVLAESVSDEIDIESLLDTDEALSYRRAGIGPDVVRKLRRGEWTIQDEIDLHGLRVDDARAALTAFLRDAFKRGLRCVRVVHGKGLGSKDRTPVLKGKVRAWLVQKDEVIAFCQARPADGGGGALVVLLKPSS
jgi:DNA-nicking Smr family endonuclease